MFTTTRWGAGGGADNVPGSTAAELRCRPGALQRGVGTCNPSQRVTNTHRRGGTRRNHSRHDTDSSSSEAAGRRHHSPLHWHHRGAQAFTFPCSARGSRRPWVPVSWDVVLMAGEADSRALSRHQLEADWQPLPAAEPGGEARQARGGWGRGGGARRGLAAQVRRVADSLLAPHERGFDLWRCSRAFSKTKQFSAPPHFPTTSGRAGSPDTVVVGILVLFLFC